MHPGLVAKGVDWLVRMTCNPEVRSWSEACLDPFLPSLVFMIPNYFSGHCCQVFQSSECLQWRNHLRLVLTDPSISRMQLQAVVAATTAVLFSTEGEMSGEQWR